tara:strand:- start:5855 stop:6703 length:849 start_codon:yes stop_codon:yes gene_type:complete
MEKKSSGVDVLTNNLSDLQTRFYKKSHKIVFGSLSLSAVEHDLFALFLSRLEKSHWAIKKDKKLSTEADWNSILLDQSAFVCPSYTFSNDMLSEWFKVEKTELYSLLNLPAKRLSGRAVGIEDKDNKSFSYMALFKRVEYKNACLTLVPNDQLIKEYLCVSEGHSQISHDIFRQLKREYSKRLYSILCRFKSYGKLPEFKIDDIRALFGLLDTNGKLKKTSYSRTHAIIREIIQPSIEEIALQENKINFFSDADQPKNYGFRTIRTGRKITAIKLLFDWDKA